MPSPNPLTPVWSYAWKRSPDLKKGSWLVWKQNMRISFCFALPLLQDFIEDLKITYKTDNRIIYDK